jgi:hypothetical protein
MEDIEPDNARLQAARNEVQTFLERRSRWTRALFVLGALCEAGFLVLLLLFTDFGEPTHRMIFVAVMFVYCPLIIFVFRNSIRIDQLYYRLVEELKYKP